MFFRCALVFGEYGLPLAGFQRLQPSLDFVGLERKRLLAPNPANDFQLARVAPMGRMARRHPFLDVPLHHLLNRDDGGFFWAVNPEPHGFCGFLGAGLRGELFQRADALGFALAVNVAITERPILSTRVQHDRPLLIAFPASSH